VRSLPGASPLMIEKGWNYYKNLTKWHVSWKVDLTSFSTKGFASNLEHWDLYFLGVEGASENRAERINAQKVAKFQALYGSRLFPVLFKRLRRVVRDPSLMTNMSARQGRW
jgi:hypothetical protein